MNGHPLGRSASLVLITGDLELLWKFPDSLGDVVHGLHRVNIGLQHGNFEILGQVVVFWLSIVHFHLFASSVR